MGMGSMSERLVYPANEQAAEPDHGPCHQLHGDQQANGYPDSNHGYIGHRRHRHHATATPMAIPQSHVGRDINRAWPVTPLTA